jgi:hypothetical protein
MMTTLNQFYFTNKSCKRNDHDRCDGIWRGLGIQVLCDCKCHVDERKRLEKIEYSKNLVDLSYYNRDEEQVSF